MQDLITQLAQINWGELFTVATVASAAVVAYVTQWIKYIPVTFTTKYAIYINIALSLVGAIVVRGIPVWDPVHVVTFLVQWFVTIAAATIAYLAVVKPSVKNPKGNLPSTPTYTPPVAYNPPVIAEPAPAAEAPVTPPAVDPARLVV